MNQALKAVLERLHATDVSKIRLRALGHAIRPDVPADIEKGHEAMDERPYQAWVEGAPHGTRTGLTEEERSLLLEAGATDVEAELDETP